MDTNAQHLVSYFDGIVSVNDERCAAGLRFAESSAAVDWTPATLKPIIASIRRSIVRSETLVEHLEQLMHTAETQEVLHN